MVSQMSPTMMFDDTVEVLGRGICFSMYAKRNENELMGGGYPAPQEAHHAYCIISFGHKGCQIVLRLLPFFQGQRIWILYLPHHSKAFVLIRVVYRTEDSATPCQVMVSLDIAEDG